GGAGVFFAGFCVRSATLKLAPIFLLRKASASAFVLKFLGILALKRFPALVENSASTRYEATGLKSIISRSRSTISRTATDCTRPADNPPLTFRHRIGDNSYPTKRSKIRLAC